MGLKERIFFCLNKFFIEYFIIVNCMGHASVSCKKNGLTLLF